MKALLKSGLGFALGLLATQAGAEEIQWRSATRTTGSPAPAAMVSPVRLGLPHTGDEGGILPASTAPSVVRAKAQPDEAKPLPAGPTLKVGEPKALDPKTK